MLLMLDPHTKYDEMYAEICCRFWSEKGSYRRRWKQVKVIRISYRVFFSRVAYVSSGTIGGIIPEFLER